MSCSSWLKEKNDKNQTKLGIVTLDSNILKGYISRFVVDFIEDVYLMFNVEEPKKKKWGESLLVASMLKLLVNAKIEHMGSAKYIACMTRYYGIYRFVSDDVQLSERSIQWYKKECWCYFEVLVQ